MIDWSTGKIVLHSQGKGESCWKLVSAGDWAALPDFQQVMLRDPLALYGKLLPIIQGADLAIVNLETVLSDRGEPIAKDGPNLRGPKEAIHSLVQAGFDVAVLANNHARDYGSVALADTITLCQEHGIRTVGAGFSLEEAWAPVYLQVQGVRVAILAMAEHEEAALWPGMEAGVAAWDLAQAVEAIREAKQHADIVIFQCHAGSEYNPLPAPRVCEGFYRLIDAGASLVIAHHPHVPLGLEEYHGGLIAYSLGNFVFDFHHREIAARVNEGYLLEVEFQGAEFVGGQIHPYRAVNGQYLEYLQGEAARDLLDHLERISRPLGNLDLLWLYWRAFCRELYRFRWEQSLAQFVEGLQSQDPTERVAKAAKLRNAFRCEAHRDVISTALNDLVEGGWQTLPSEVIAEVLELNPWLRQA
ncbi:MAG: CapA family protein [Anaerolineae bacterium]|nr:CapA family protein [Anaerolineae bacterium]